MKKIYLLLLVGVTYFSTIAQVTIADLDMAIGDTIVIQNDTVSVISGIDLAATIGDGQVWDYTNLISHETEYVRLQAPTDGIWDDEFPDADLMVYNDDDSNYIYLDKTSSYLKVIGFVELSNGDTDLINFTIPFINFPSSLGTSNVETTEFMFSNYFGIDPDGAIGPHPTVDSIRSRIERNIYLDIDAEGVLKLPNASFDVIRQV